MLSQALYTTYHLLLGFLGGSEGKESLAMQETWVRFQGWEDPLEEGIATQSSILSWRISMDRRTWQAIAHGVAKNRT